VLLDEILVAGSITAVAAHFASSSPAMFAAMKHLASASGIVVVASEIGGTAIASTSVVCSSVMAWKIGYAVRSEA
jgi:hypothetical protein